MHDLDKVRVYLSIVYVWPIIKLLFTKNVSKVQQVENGVQGNTKYTQFPIFIISQYHFTDSYKWVLRNMDRLNNIKKQIKLGYVTLG